MSQVFQEVRKVTRLNDRTKFSDFNKVILNAFKTSNTFTLFLKSLRFKDISSAQSHEDWINEHIMEG